MDTFSHVPPGFRFHPTDEELVDYYLRKKIASRRIDLDVIRDVDLYKIEPWDLQELCKIGTAEQNDWYFFSHKDKKYPTGTRTNRATKAGFWKATGRDKAIYTKHSLVGMRKTLVYYKGRAPNGQKSDWIMHEYRLETNENGSTSQEEGWVVCRVFKKRIASTTRKMGDHNESPCWYDDQQLSFMPDFGSPRQFSLPYTSSSSYNQHEQIFPCKQELELQHYNNVMMPHDPFLPPLESPKISQQPSAAASNLQSSSTLTQLEEANFGSIYSEQLTDWRVLDKFVASQLSHEDGTRDQNIGNASSSSAPTFEVSEYASSVSTPTCPIDLWK